MFEYLQGEELKARDKSGYFGGDVGAAMDFEKMAINQPISQDRSRWEQGDPDYAGEHSFDNILKKIDSTMSKPGKFEFIEYTALAFYAKVTQKKFWRKKNVA